MHEEINLVDGFQLAPSIQLGTACVCPTAVGFHGTALGLHRAYGVSNGACFMVDLLILMLKAVLYRSCSGCRWQRFGLFVCADTKLRAQHGPLLLSHHLH